MSSAGQSQGTIAPKVAAGALLLVLLAGCSSVGDSYGSASTSTSSSPSFTDRFTQMLSGGTTASASATPADDQQTLYCPSVDVRSGASTLSVAATGKDAATGVMQLRYQGTLGQTARECSSAAGNLSIKVGVQGRLILGPAGTPGQIEVPLRYALVQEGPEPKTIWTKLYRFPVMLEEGQASVPFTHIEEDMIVPMPKRADLESYVVYIGFDMLARPEPAKKPAPAKKR